MSTACPLWTVLLPAFPRRKDVCKHVFSWCLAYGERMYNVFAIGTHTLKCWICWYNDLASAYKNVYRRVSAYG